MKLSSIAAAALAVLVLVAAPLDSLAQSSAASNVAKLRTIVTVTDPATSTT